MAATESVNNGNSCKKGKWTPLNIAAIIVGFVFLWPVGLFLLIWVLAGRDMRDLANVTLSLISKLASLFGRHTVSGNRVFDDFQQTQFDRIEEIKAEIRERFNAFRAYKEQRDRRAEQHEFDEFMKMKPSVAGNEAAGE